MQPSKGQNNPYIAPPFVRAGPQPIYPNELISIYRKISSVKALLIQKNREIGRRTSQAASIKTLTYSQNLVGKKA
jgi:hypothetical protein